MLANLTLSEVSKREAGNGDMTARVRAKLVSAINEQKSYIESRKNNTSFVATRKVAGETRERRFRPWAFKSIGLWFTSINYGASALELQPGKRSIQCGEDLDSVLKVYDHVIEAVKAGELDKTLLEAAGKRGRKKRAEGQQQAPEKPSDAPSKPAAGAAVSGSARARNRG